MEKQCAADSVRFYADSVGVAYLLCSQLRADKDIFVGKTKLCFDNPNKLPFLSSAKKLVHTDVPRAGSLRLGSPQP